MPNSDYADTEALFPRVQVEQPSLKDELLYSIKPLKDLVMETDDPFDRYRGKSSFDRFKLFAFTVLPCLRWISNYKLSFLFGDVVAGLTISSLAVPQDLGYAKLANLPPVNGLYSSFVPPLLYAVFGTSNQVAIGPVAVVSLLLGNLCKDYYPPTIKAPSPPPAAKFGEGLASSTSKTITNPAYYNLAITATFFAGVFQLGMGLLRLGFVIDFLSHAVIIGFMAGAAITIGLQQLKGGLGYSDFTTNTDIVSVFKSVDTYSNEFSGGTFGIFIAFLMYLWILKLLNYYFPKNKIIFFTNALGPLTAVIISTFCVWATKAYHSIKVVGPITKGVNPGSTQHIYFTGDLVGQGASVGIVVALVGLTEGVAIGRTFATLKGYHIDGNQEMIAFGAGNLIGSMTSCYVSTGSFSRSAVNYAAGANSPLTNVIMSIVILITLVAITPVFKDLPNAVLASIIISAVTTLVNLPAAYRVWKTDKLDFIALLGAFFGVLFISIEYGLLIAVAISFAKMAIQIARPHTAVLGRVEGTGVYRSVQQYPDSVRSPGILVFRIDATMYFANVNFIREKILRIIEKYSEQEKIQFLILELTPVADIDTSGIEALQELLRALRLKDIQLGLSNPAKPVLWKLNTAKYIETLGEEWLFLSADQAVRTCENLLKKTTYDNGYDNSAAV